MSRRGLKSLLRATALAAAFPAAAWSAFGRWTGPFTFFSHLFALLPGFPGDYLRVAFYRLTLSECAPSSRVSFGSFFAHPEARVGPHAYIGAYCIIGKARIGHHAQIASGVQILSGNRQHRRNERGEISGAEDGAFQVVTLGDHCWIGAASVIMADVGDGATVGAGSVVASPIPPNCVAVGSPARVIRPAVGTPG